MAKPLRMLQWKDELEPFIAWLHRRFNRAIHVLEIGTAHGGLMQRLGHEFPGLMISVDMPTPNDPTSVSMKAMLERNDALTREFGARFTGVIGNSQTAQTLLEVDRVLACRLIDLLFIDGDDSYEGTLTDYVSYRRFLSMDSVVAIHDIATPHCDRPRFWQDVRDGNKVEFIGDKHPWGGIGIIC